MKPGPVFWIAEVKPSRASIVARPRGGDWLRDDLRLLRHAGLDILVSLLEPDEAVELGLAEESKLAGNLGMTFISHPIPDRALPTDLAGFRALVVRLAEAVRQGRSLGVHCRGCIGRSTVLLASVLAALDYPAAEVLLWIEDARGWPVPDTPEQRDWILSFAAESLQLHPGQG
jgi:hypothetical protein